jgi:hypothetical protein
MPTGEGDGQAGLIMWLLATNGLAGLSSAAVGHCILVSILYLTTYLCSSLQDVCNVSLLKPTLLGEELCGRQQVASVYDNNADNKYPGHTSLCEA